MADQKPKPIVPEFPKQAETEIKKTASESENFEILEKVAESESKKEEQLIDELAELKLKMSGAAPSAGVSGAVAALDEDIEQKKERIIGNFVRAAQASNFSDGEVTHVMGIAERYIRRDYPDIADEIHDRVIQAREESRDGK
jgi:hypothetical protein